MRAENMEFFDVVRSRRSVREFLDKPVPSKEIETCLSALYGLLMLRLQHREISGETQSAIAQISSLLRMLALKYKMEKEGKLEL